MIKAVNQKAPTIGNVQPDIYCQIGINTGPTFVAEIGEPRGRREYNVLGDTVNTTARLMNHAEKNQIIISERVRQAIESEYECKSLGEVSLKGKNKPMQLYELLEQKKEN